MDLGHQGPVRTSYLSGLKGGPGTISARFGNHPIRALTPKMPELRLSNAYHVACSRYAKRSPWKKIK
jgi:hypothetical protein